MNIYRILLIASFLATLPVAAQHPPCSDRTADGQYVPHSVNQEVLSFSEPLRAPVYVRVFGADGRLIPNLDIVLDPNDIKSDRTVRLPLRGAPFYPEQRFIATTASVGCVRGAGRRPPQSPCVAWFDLERATAPPIDIIVDGIESDSTNTIVEVTLELHARGGGTCITQYTKLPGEMIEDVLDGETVELLIRTKFDRSPVWSVDMRRLREKGSYRISAATVTDAFKVTERHSGQGGSGSSLNQIAAAAPRGTVTVRVAR
jgi:hypothetical protein